MGYRASCLACLLWVGCTTRPLAIDEGPDRTPRDFAVGTRLDLSLADLSIEDLASSIDAGPVHDACPELPPSGPCKSGRACVYPADDHVCLCQADRWGCYAFWPVVRTSCASTMELGDVCTSTSTCDLTIDTFNFGTFSLSCHCEPGMRPGCGF